LPTREASAEASKRSQPGDTKTATINGAGLA
jgi:hypothetical protein